MSDTRHSTASVVIAAHNEGQVIANCLDGILGDSEPGEFDVTVVANGCSDNTATVARSRAGVRVVELADAGKTAALNVGDELASGFPRVYLDADTAPAADDLRRLCTVLTERAADGVLAVCPARRIELQGRPLAVRAYFRVNERLPVYDGSLFGRGLVVLAEEGRSRFTRFPDVVADDLFLDSLFDSGEKLQVDDVVAVVAAPLGTRQLIRRLERVRRGNRELRSSRDAMTAGRSARPARQLSWLFDVVLKEPRLMAPAVVYVTITLVAEYRSRRQCSAAEWGQDESTRSLAPLPRPAGVRPDRATHAER